MKAEKECCGREFDPDSARHEDYVKNLAIAPIDFVRLHGRPGDTWFVMIRYAFVERYSYLYSTEELAPWASRIRNENADAQKVLR